MASINVKKENLIKRIFLFNLAACGVLVLGFVIFLIAQGNISAHLTKELADSFSDFSEIMQFALSGNPYSSAMQSSYPPLAILILYLPALICRSVIHLDNYQMIQTPQFWTSFCLFYIVFFAASAILLKKLTGLKGKNFLLFCLLLLSGGPLLFMVERGNIIISAFVFLLFFLSFYNSPNKVLKELALVSLAISGTIKIYPLFFGILLLRDKRIFESARVAAYFFILFLIPFLCFKGGFSNFSAFFGHLGGFGTENNRLLSVRNISAAGLVYKFFHVLGLIFGTSLTAISNIASTVAFVLCSAIAIIGAFFAKNKFSVLMLCASAVTMVPSISYYYSIIFFIIPLIEYVLNYDTFCKKRKNFYLIFFIAAASMAFCALPMVLGAFILGTLLYEATRNINHFFKSKQNKNLGDT